MAEYFNNGDEIVIKGTITRTSGSSSSSNDIYSEKGSTVSESINTGAVELSSEVAKETIVSTAIAQAQNIGASGVIALSSATYFQADAIVDNSVQIVQEASPMIHELNTTGTITPPENSKYAGEVIPKTTSFMGIKVGEGKKEVSAEEKALQEAFIKGAVPNNLKEAEQDGSSI